MLELQIPLQGRGMAGVILKGGLHMEERQRITLDIEGMSCASCAQRLAKALGELPGRQGGPG